MTVLKRSRDQLAGDVEGLAMANSLMLLSRVGATAGGRVFACKTCNREFPSFQALGGHRASHKKPRLTTADGDFLHFQTPEKPKTHECSICGVEFAIGQALGGHMRRHRPASSVSGGDEKAVQKSVGSSDQKRDTFLDLNLTLAPMWLVA